MAKETDVVELLRSRLADLEARQRTSGGTSDPGFWERFASPAPTRDSAECGAAAGVPAGVGTGGSGGRSTRGSRRRRPEAPEARPVNPGYGPWSGLPLELLLTLDPQQVPWQDAAGYDEMVNDPTWLAAAYDRAAAADT